MRIEINQKTYLKQFKTEDAESLFKALDESRESLREWLPFVDKTRTVKDSMSFIEETIDSYNKNKSLQFGVWHEGSLVGAMGQHKIPWLNKWCSLGYWLGEKYTGKGIMTSSVKALLPYLFEEQKLNCVEICAAVGNSKSRAIPDRLGFKLEGILRQREIVNGKVLDHACYSLLREEWSP